jgi:raffinose/stachyose/melibiose transport system substrate-binding protein
MKKTVAILLALAMIGMLAGCSSDPAGSSSQSGASSSASQSEQGEALSGELSILSWYSDELIGAWVEHYNELYPDVTVEYQYAQAVAPYMEKLQALIMSGAVPDLVLMVAENRYDFVANDMVMDLTNQPIREKMSDSAIKQITFDGKIYAVTIGGSIGGLLVNMDLWEQAGLKDEPKTWDELTAAMAALNGLEGVTGFIDCTADAALTIATPLYGATWMYGEPDYEDKIETGEKTYADYWEPIFTTLKTDLYDTGLMKAESMGIPWDTVISNFALGKVGMIMGASWNFADLNAINPDLNYKIMGVPNQEGTCKYYCGDCLEPSFCVMKDGKNQENAMYFLNSLFDEESLKAAEEIAGMVVCVDGFESKWADNPVCADAFIEGMQAGNQFMPQSYWRKDVDEMVAKYTANNQAILLGEKTPMECAEDFDAIFNR